MNFLCSFRIGPRLGAAFAMVLMLTIGAALSGIYQLNGAVEAYVRLLGYEVAHERSTAQIEVHFKTQVQEWKNVLLRGKDPKQLEKYWAAFQKSEREVEQNARALHAAHDAPGDAETRERIDAFMKAHAALGAAYRKGYDAFVAAGFDASVGDQAVQGADRPPSKLLAEMVAANVKDQAAANERVSAQARQATLWSLALMLASCVLAAVLAWLVTRSLTQPIASAVKVAETVASGDLTSHIEVVGRDESAQLLAALKRMNDSLVNIVGQVRDASESIATGSSQIATGNADLSQRTEEQASNLQQTAASMEQLTATVKQNADTAMTATRLAGSASSVAEEGGSVVSRVVHTMGDINASSKRIADIIGVIDGIAFQTNILALNAAVEAARAGEQGRGFAVVAGEVRSLAQRSAQAAKEIKGLIGESVGKVEAGTRLVGDAGQTMDSIVSQVRRVSDLISQISAASTEQSGGIGQIGDAVQQLDHVTQQNAALVEQSAAAAESLKQQAARLAHTVSVFQLAPDEQ